MGVYRDRAGPPIEDLSLRPPSLDDIRRCTFRLHLMYNQCWSNEFEVIERYRRAPAIRKPSDVMAPGVTARLKKAEAVASRLKADKRLKLSSTVKESVPSEVELP